MFQAGSCAVRRDAQLAVVDSCVLAAGHQAAVLWDCSPAIARVQNTDTPSYTGDAADLCPSYATVHVRVQHPQLIAELQAMDADLAAGIAALLSRSESNCLEASSMLCTAESCAAAYAAVWSSIIKDCFGSVAPDSLVQPLVQRVLQQGWTIQHQRTFEFILPDPDVRLRDVACVQADTASSSAELLWQVLPTPGSLPARITPQSIASAAQHADTGSLLGAWSAARRALQAERNRTGAAGLWLRQVEADWPLGLRVTAVHGALDVLPFALVPKPSTAAVPAAEKHKKHKRSKTGGAADSGLVLEVDATGTPTAAPASTAGAGAAAAASAASPGDDGGAPSAAAVADAEDALEHHHGSAVSAEDLANLQLPVPGTSGMVQLTGIFVQADIVCGSVVLEDCHMQTPLRAFGNRVVWAEDPGHCHAAGGAGAWLRTLRHIRDVPPEARLRLRVCAASDPTAGVQLSDPVLLSQVLLPLSDAAGAWAQGRIGLTMWPGQADLRGCPPGEFVSPQQVHGAFTAAMEDATAARAEARAQGQAASSSDVQHLRVQAMQPVQWRDVARSGSDLDMDVDTGFDSSGAQAAGPPASPPGAPQRPPPAPTAAGAAEADQGADLPPSTPLDTLTVEEEQETRAAVLHAIRQASDGASSDRPRRSSAAPCIDSGGRRRRPTGFKADMLQAAKAAALAESVALPARDSPDTALSSAADDAAGSAASARDQSADAAVAEEEVPAWLVPSTPQEPWMHAYCKRPVHIEVELDLGALPLVSDEAPAAVIAQSTALRLGVLHSVPPLKPSSAPVSAPLQQPAAALDRGLVQCPQPYEMRARMLHIAALLGYITEQGQLSLPRTSAARQALAAALHALPGLPSSAAPLQQALHAVSPGYLAQWQVVNASQVPTLVWPRLAQWVARVALATQLGTAAPGRKLSFYDSAYGEQRRVARPGEHDPAAGLHGQLNHKFMEHFHVSMDKRGWMRKLGAHMLSRWHRRWFVLSETKGTLCYFESNMSSGEEPRGVIDLQGKAARPVPKKNRAYQRTVGSTRKDLELHCFEVYATAASDRIFRMYCETQQEMESWVDAINTVAAAARRRATVSAAGASRASVLRAMSLANLLGDSAQRGSSKSSIESGGASQTAKAEQARQQLAEQVADLAEQSMHVCAAASMPGSTIASPEASVQEWTRRRRSTRMPSAVVAGSSGAHSLGAAAAADPQGRCVSHPNLQSGLSARVTKDQRDQAALCLDAIYAAAEASAAALQSASLLKLAVPGLARVMPGWECGASEAASLTSAALSQSPATGPQPGAFADAAMPLLWSTSSSSTEQLLGLGAPAVAWTLCAQQCAGWPDAALQLPVQSSVPRRERDTSVSVRSASVARAAAALRSACARGSGAASPGHGAAPAGSQASTEWQLSLASGMACIARDPGAVAVLFSAAPAGQVERLSAALRAAQAGQLSDEHSAVLHSSLLAAMGTVSASQAPAPDVVLGSAQSAAPAHAAHLYMSPIAALIASAMVSTTGTGPELAASVAQAGGQLQELWNSCLPKLPAAFVAALRAARPGDSPTPASPVPAPSAPESAIGQAVAVRVWAASFAAAVLAAVHRTSKLAAQWCSTRVPDMFADESTRLDETALERLSAAGTAVTTAGVLRAARSWLRSFTAVVLGHAPELQVPPGLELALKHLKLPNRAVFCVGLARASVHKASPAADSGQPARALLGVGVGHHANAADESWLAWEASAVPDSAAESLACVAPPAVDALAWWQGLQRVERCAALSAAAWLQGRPAARSISSLHTDGAWLQVSQCVIAAQADPGSPSHGLALPMDGSGGVWRALVGSALAAEGPAGLEGGVVMQGGAGDAPLHLTPAMLPPGLDQPVRTSGLAQQQLCSVLCDRQASHLPIVDLKFQPEPAAGGTTSEAAAPSASPGASTPSSVIALPGRKATQSKVAAASSALDVLSRADPLTPVPIVQRMIVFEHRVRAMTLPETLPKIATCVVGASRRATRELHRLLYDWATLPRTRAREYLQLLDDRMADMQLRHFAAHAVAALSDDTIALLAPQLIQALKAEPFLHNSLLQMLLLRLRSSPCTLAIPLFWAMEVEASSNPVSYASMALSMRVLTTHAPPATRALLCEQQSLWGKNGVFAAVCRHVQEQKGASGAKLQARARQALGELASVLKSPLTLPLDARMRVGKLVVEKCKVMDSAKLPLWLTFEHPESPGELLRIIFKAGDDIRQDMLTLQLVRAMDAMWKSEGMDLAMTPYACTATWNDGGLLQIVPNSATLAQIQVETGGKLGAFRQAALAQWLADQCGGAGSAAYAAAVDRFVRSCAGYCVAMYVLGIGDRHNDNIMMTEDGRLFHIDFGHILGYKKYAGGFSRERTGFVFTPEMLHVMGGKDGEAYLRWKDTVGKALIVLRKHATELLSVLQLSLHARMPELRTRDDIGYLRERLRLDLSDEAAVTVFLTEADKALSDFYKRLDNTIHILVHA